jgi:hypothetical protein
MNKRLSSLLAVAAVGSALLAGCGSSSSSTTTASSTPAASSTTSSAAPASTSTASSASSSSASGGASLANNPQVKAAVAKCKSSINAAPTLSASAKAKLVTICDEAAKGDPASLRKAEAKVCQELVKDTVPAAAQQQALASCPKA